MRSALSCIVLWLIIPVSVVAKPGFVEPPAWRAASKEAMVSSLVFWDDEALETLLDAMAAIGPEALRESRGFRSEIRIVGAADQGPMLSSGRWLVDGQPFSILRQPFGERANQRWSQERSVGIAGWPGGVVPHEFRVRMLKSDRSDAVWLAQSAAGFPLRYSTDRERSLEQVAEHLPDYSLSYQAAAIASMFPFVFLDWERAAGHLGTAVFDGIEVFEGKRCRKVRMPMILSALEPFEVPRDGMDCWVLFDIETSLPHCVRCEYPEWSRGAGRASHEFIFDDWVERDGVMVFLDMRRGGSAPAMQRDLRIRYLQVSADGKAAESFASLSFNEFAAFSAYLGYTTPLAASLAIGAAAVDLKLIDADLMDETKRLWFRDARGTPQQDLREFVTIALERELHRLWLECEIDFWPTRRHDLRLRRAAPWITALFPEVSDVGSTLRLLSALARLGVASRDDAVAAMTTNPFHEIDVGAVAIHTDALGLLAARIDRMADWLGSARSPAELQSFIAALQAELRSEDEAAVRSGFAAPRLHDVTLSPKFRDDLQSKQIPYQIAISGSAIEARTSLDGRLRDPEHSIRWVARDSWMIHGVFTGITDPAIRNRPTAEAVLPLLSEADLDTWLRLHVVEVLPASYEAAQLGNPVAAYGAHEFARLALPWLRPGAMGVAVRFTGDRAGWLRGLGQQLDLKHEVIARSGILSDDPDDRPLSAWLRDLCGKYGID